MRLPSQSTKTIFAVFMLTYALWTHGVQAEEDDEKDTTAHRKPTSLIIVTIFILFGIVGEKVGSTRLSISLRRLVLAIHSMVHGYSRTKT